MLIGWLSSPVSDTPIPSASSAVTSGSNEASSAPPNTTSSTASAAAMPTPTERPRPTRSELVMAWAAQGHVHIGPSAVSAALISFFASAEVDLVRRLGPGHAGERDGADQADLC